MASQRVQARGQLTLPADVRRSAGISPGDSVIVCVAGPGEILIKRHKTLSLEELRSRFPLDEEVAGRPVSEILAEAETEQGDILLGRILGSVE